MKVIDLVCGAESEVNETLFRPWVMRNGMILDFTDPPAPIKGKYKSFPILGVLQWGGTAPFSLLSQFPLSLWTFPASPRKLVPRDETAESPSMRFRGRELRGVESQGPTKI